MSSPDPVSPPSPSAPEARGVGPTTVETLDIAGWEVVRLSTATIAVDVVPALGATITSVRRRRDDLDVLWRSPWGLRARGTTATYGNAETAYWESSPGGWQTVFPNGGEAATMHGTEWGIDGEARVAPFDHRVTEAGSLIMTTRLVRTPFELTKIVSLKGDTVSLGVTVVNRGGKAMESMWSEQLAFGAPLLGADATVESSASLVHPDPAVVYDTSYSDIMPWPRTQTRTSTINLRNLPGPEGDERRLVYLDELADGSLSIENPTVGLRVELGWDVAAWPYVVYDLEAGHSGGFPYFDRGYRLALQPSSSWPSKSVYDARRVSSSTVWFDPDESRTSYLDLTLTDLG